MTPDGEINPLTEGAIQYHVMFENLVKGGFKEDQALKLIAYLILATGEKE